MIIGIAGKMRSGKDTLADILQYHYWNGLDGPVSYSSYKLMGTYNKFKIRKFADPIKDIICDLLGVDRHTLEYNEFKNKNLGENWKAYGLTMYPGDKDHIFSSHEQRDAFIKREKIDHSYVLWEREYTPRDLMQIIGTEFFRNQLHPNTWINAVLKDYRPDISNWIISDVRFINEAEAIKDRGGFIIRITRDTELRFPELWEEFQSQDKYDEWDEFLYHKREYQRVYHPSENEIDFIVADYELSNNGTIQELVFQVKELLNHDLH